MTIGLGRLRRSITSFISHFVNCKTINEPQLWQIVNRARIPAAPQTWKTIHKLSSTHCWAACKFLLLCASHSLMFTYIYLNFVIYGSVSNCFHFFFPSVLGDRINSEFISAAGRWDNHVFSKIQVTLGLHFHFADWRIIIRNICFFFSFG